MSEKITRSTHTVFEQIRQTGENGNEYWSAREMGKVLEYSEYRHFLPVVEKAKEACLNSKQRVADHFEDFLDMIEIGKGGRREVGNIRLSRYACYLIVQNANPTKEVVALGQTYFAVQTRLREIEQMEEYNLLSTEDEKRLFLRSEMSQHNIKLAAAAKDAGVIQPLFFKITAIWGFTAGLMPKAFTNGRA